MLLYLWFAAIMSAAAPGAQDVLSRWSLAMERQMIGGATGQP
jgi:hypothetical protein